MLVRAGLSVSQCTVQYTVQYVSYYTPKLIGVKVFGAEIGANFVTITLTLLVPISAPISLLSPTKYFIAVRYVRRLCGAHRTVMYRSRLD